LDETRELFSDNHGTTPDLIYAKGVPDFPSLDPTSLKKNQCTLFLIEIVFCGDFGCDNKIAEKTEKYPPPM
jgi:hypothetical protein